MMEIEKQVEIILKMVVDFVAKLKKMEKDLELREEGLKTERNALNLRSLEMEGRETRLNDQVKLVEKEKELAREKLTVLEEKEKKLNAKIEQVNKMLAATEV